MNYYIKAQIAHIIVMTKTFEDSCLLAATENDGEISKAEQKAIQKIRTTSDKFIHDLEKISEKY